MATPPKAYRRFLNLLALGTLLGLLGIAAFTVGVDPYRTFGWVRIEGFNTMGIKVGNDRLVKANVMYRREYDGVILGTSQAQFGIDPESPALRELSTRFYNAGLLSATPYQMLRYLQHAAGINSVKAAVVVVDLLLFTEHPMPTMQAAFSESRLSVSKDGKPQNRWLDPDLVTQVLSFDALRMSLATVLKQDPIYRHLLPNGLRAPENLELELQEKGGMREAFHQSEHSYLTSYDDFDLYGDDGRSRGLEDLATLIRYARANGIELLLLFPPAHARQLEVLRVSGHLSDLDRLKREVVAMLAEEAREAGAPPYAVWDFGSPSALTTEEVPPEGDTTSRMRHYYDTAHFRPTLGAMALARALVGPSGDIPHDFGVRLTPDTIDDALTDARAAFERYTLSHAADVEEIRALKGELNRTALAQTP